MLVGSDSHRFDVVRRLALSRGLLHHFIGYVVARNFVANDEVEAIAGRELQAVVHGKIAERAGIGIVLRDYGFK